jgi:hypothetical protein
MGVGTPQIPLGDEQREVPAQALPGRPTLDPVCLPEGKHRPNPDQVQALHQLWTQGSIDERRLIEGSDPTGKHNTPQQHAGVLGFTLRSSTTGAWPGLKDTSIDDALVRQFSGEVLDWAWELIGNQINALGRALVNNDTSLPNGGLK